MGGHKGFGLSLLVDILCGVITGGSFQHHLKSMYVYPQDPSNTAHLMLVINPLCLLNRQELKERMAEFFDTVKHSPMWDAQAEMLLPGEIEYRMEKERRSSGIPIPAPLYEELLQLGKNMNLDAPLGLVSASDIG
jgi:LDH2 family malate/lactate/ureidoglycolate dehydrogenase